MPYGVGLIRRLATFKNATGRILTTISVMMVALVAVAVAGYYPGRPSGATLQTFTGTITDYSKGNGFGAFGLKIKGVDTSFYLGSPVKMNGVVVTCQDPAFPSSGFCSDWPSAIVIGKSVVTATCWIDTTYAPGH
jgi:hypothetical protein